MANEYKVLRITELSRVRDEGGIEHYYRHTLKTKGGTILTVDIDLEDFTPEKSAPLLQAAAKNADAILKL
ncbi:MAG: hypothetical protein HWN68_10930 [Desulfobacterales bacterium]|nr:hypothetical protein [Desulfobacterales bacterium]